MPSSISTTNATEVEVISAYACAQQQVDAVAAAPAWIVIGAFWMPQGAPVRIEAIGHVSGAGTSGTVLTLRLFNVTDSVAVNGSTTADIDGTTDERQLSGAFDLPGNKLYQFQAQCIESTETEYAIVRSAQLVSA